MPVASCEAFSSRLLICQKSHSRHIKSPLFVSIASFQVAVFLPFIVRFSSGWLVHCHWHSTLRWLLRFPYVSRHHVVSVVYDRFQQYWVGELQSASYWYWYLLLLTIAGKANWFFASYLLSAGLFVLEISTSRSNLSILSSYEAETAPCPSAICSSSTCSLLNAAKSSHMLEMFYFHRLKNRVYF